MVRRATGLPLTSLPTPDSPGTLCEKPCSSGRRARRVEGRAWAPVRAPSAGRVRHPDVEHLTGVIPRKIWPPFATHLEARSLTNLDSPPYMWPWPACSASRRPELPQPLRRSLRIRAENKTAMCIIKTAMRSAPSLARARKWIWVACPRASTARPHPRRARPRARARACRAHPGARARGTSHAPSWAI